MRAVDEIIAFGSALIRATHRSTFEVTKEDHLTERGDCIIAIRANKSARDLDESFKAVARSLDARITIIIEVGGEKDVVKAFGSPSLTFAHPTDIVVRKSSYVCGRTIAIRADKAACDLSRSLIRRLMDPGSIVRVTLIAER
ncbi:MAG: DUF371 domain-containing protein [Candidatus Bathyarchaeia archaeon]|nr:DUF371 domain-containing protein [Candidatus Bathyarchaeota archaeon]